MNQQTYLWLHRIKRGVSLSNVVLPQGENNGSKGQLIEEYEEKDLKQGSVGIKLECCHGYWETFKQHDG